MNLKSFLKYHLLFILWLLIIFIQSSFPAIELPKIELISADKVIHMGVYGLLAILCYISLVHLSKTNTFSLKPFAWSFIITSLYGASDEIHQYFVPYRSCELFDWLADVAGAVIAMLLIKYYFQYKIRLLRRTA